MKNKSLPLLSRKILRYFIFLFLLFSVFISSVLFFITTEFGSNYIIKIAKQKKDLFLNNNYDFEIEKVETNIFTKSIIKNISLSKISKNNNKEIIFSISKLEVDYSLYDVFFNKKLKNISVDRIFTNIKQDSLGINIIKAFKIPTSSALDEKEIENFKDKENSEKDIFPYFIMEKVAVNNFYSSYINLDNGISLNANLFMNLNYDYLHKTYYFESKFTIPEISNNKEFIAKNTNFILNAKLNDRVLSIDKFQQILGT